MPTSTSRRLGARPYSDIRAHALVLGFDDAGITRPAALRGAAAGLRAFLALGRHGDMTWLAANAERRADPTALWPAARSVVVVALNYGPETDPRADLADRARGVISVYARGRDYHEVLKPRLKALGRWLIAHHGGEVRVFVDTAPVLEKPLAAAAGIGWQGKHTNLVSRRFGSWLFLGALFTSAELPSDRPEADHCGGCAACLAVCPTHAFPAPYLLDARRCISYLTIEHKGPIPRAFRAAMGNRIYGCDDCLAVCPWNKFARRAREAAFEPRAALTAPRLADLARLDDRAFRRLFAGTAIKRTGRARFVRNVLIALGNARDATQAAVVVERLTDPSALVRGMAAWALAQLAPAEFERWRDRLLPGESDGAVRAEWQAGSA